MTMSFTCFVRLVMLVTGLFEFISAFQWITDPIVQLKTAKYLLKPEDIVLDYKPSTVTNAYTKLIPQVPQVVIDCPFFIPWGMLK